MATRPPTSGCGRSSLGLLSAVTLLLLLLLSASLAVAGASIIDEACAATPHPDLCRTTILANPDSKDAATPRAVAEVAIRAASDVGAAAGTYAREQLDLAGDNAMWKCLDECGDDIEEAVSHLDDTEGEIDDARFNDVKLFLDTAEKDSYSCDDSCRHAPETPVKGTLLAKNNNFETIMTVTKALVRQATGGAAPAPAPTIMPSSAP